MFNYVRTDHQRAVVEGDGLGGDDVGPAQHFHAHLQSIQAAAKSIMWFIQKIKMLYGIFLNC